MVLPEAYQTTVLRELHNEMGHQGVERTTSLAMQREIEHYVTQSCACLKPLSAPRQV